MSPKSSSAWSLILHLLREPKLASTGRRVAADLGISAAAVNDVLRFLEFHGAVRLGPLRVRWGRLAHVAGMIRFTEMQPRRILYEPVSVTDAAARLSQADVPHALAYTTAANRWAYFEPAPQAHIIVPPRWLPKAVQAIETAVAPAPQSTIYLFEQDLEALEVKQIGDVRLTGQLQTWLDLQHFPLAGAHHAFFTGVIQDLYPHAEAVE